VSHSDLGHDELRDATAAWWLLMLVGLIGVAAGVIVLAKPSDSLTTLAVIAGIFVLIDGVVDLVASLRGSTSNRGLSAVMGVLCAVVGVLLIRHPFHGVLAVALLLGIWLIAAGVVRIIRAFDGRRSTWGIVVALLEIVAGIVIVAAPPIGFATLALLVGISFIANGVGMFALGWLMHAARHEAAGPTVDAGAIA